jgi:D-alanyl-lipoteichoic acid acyltransferase DltB (MBOAT superfamily)
MAVGYFKKLVIADAIAKHIGNVFEAPQSYHGFAFVLAAVLFSVQIYCDFSGYSDIAIGTAKLFDIKLMTNFKSPYFSQSVKEFWSKWHISLSTWFKDYLYIPLGGNRVGKLRNAFNLMVTFLVSGLWHGANWTFVIWGGIHGLVQVAENLILGKKHRKSKGALAVLRMAAVFAFCVFTWIFFASKSFGDVTYIFTHMFSGIAQPAAYFIEGLKGVGLTFNKTLFLVASIIILFVYDGISVKKDVIETVSSKKAPVRWAVYILFTIWILCNIPVTDATEFIYFQF